jgi:myo-inositol-1(or 4)-monophosphatase
MNPKTALDVAKKVGDEVRKAVKDIAGKEESNETVGIGKDGTPTKKIDKIAEDTALEILGEYDLRVVTEEAGVVGDGDVFVALDPIDGTFNAVKGLPIYSVSMCFSKSNRFGDAFLGYVLNLATGTEYYSLNGKSFKDGEPIRVSDETDVKKADVVFYYPKRDFGFKRMRILGCASLEICFVADGTFDAFIDVRGRRGYLRVFDVSAGLFIAKNSGAVVTDDMGRDLNDKVFSMEERFKLVVSSPGIHKSLLRLLKA